jgi:hypothetical protein
MPWIARGCNPYTKLRVLPSKGPYAGREPVAAEEVSKSTMWSAGCVREPEGWIVLMDGTTVLSWTSIAVPAGSARARGGPRFLGEIDAESDGTMWVSGP